MGKSKLKGWRNNVSLDRKSDKVTFQGGMPAGMEGIVLAIFANNIPQEEPEGKGYSVKICSVATRGI